ncbi:MAG: DUF3313 family protein [Gammaproteobacteria bacterium]
MNRTLNCVGVAVGCALVMASGLLRAAETPELTHDGLARVESKYFKEVYVRPGASFDGYARMALLDCQVVFRKNWQRDQRLEGRRVTSKDMDAIRATLATDFRSILTQTLNAGGYTLVDQNGDDVLIVRPAIVGLDVTAPDTNEPGRGRTFTTSAGEATLLLEAYDGPSGEILARVIDRERGRDMGRMMWQNAVTNRAEADRIMRKWADLLRQALDNARGKPPAS